MHLCEDCKREINSTWKVNRVKAIAVAYYSVFYSPALIYAYCLLHAHRLIRNGEKVWDMEERRWVTKEELSHLMEVAS